MRFIMFIALLALGAFCTVGGLNFATRDMEEGTIACMLVGGLAMLLAYRMATGESAVRDLRPSAGRGGGEPTASQELEAMQGLMRGLDKMESRIANLETILMERGK